MEEFVTAKEAAKELGLHYQTFMTRVRRGHITVVKKGWGVFVHREELNRIKINGSHTHQTALA